VGGGLDLDHTMQDVQMEVLVQQRFNESWRIPQNVHSDVSNTHSWSGQPSGSCVID